MTAGESTDLPTSATPAAAPVARRRPSPETVADLVLTVLLLALFAWGYLEAGQWSFQAGLFPHLVTGASVLISALHLVQVLIRLTREVRTGVVAAPDPGAAEEDPERDDVEYLFQTAGAGRWAAALGWIAAFFVLLYVAGLYLTAPIFSLLYLRFVGRRSWLFSALYAVVIGAVLYAAFAFALRVPTPPGLFLD
jgi:Tripartite tricarboxylate transporter TctB family